MSKADDKIGCVYITCNFCGYGYNGYAESHTCLPKEKTNKQIAEEIVKDSYTFHTREPTLSEDALIEKITAALDQKTVHISDEEIEKEAAKSPFLSTSGLNNIVIQAFEGGARWARSKYEGEK